MLAKTKILRVGGRAEERLAALRQVCGVVEQAAQVDQAVERAAALRPDAILIDGLPESDARECCRRLGCASATTGVPRLVCLPALCQDTAALLECGATDISLATDPLELVFQRLASAVQFGELQRRCADLASEVEHLRREADVAADTQAAFLASVSHEIRTPVTTMVGFAEMMLDEQASGEEKRDAGLRIQRNAQQLLAQLDDILQVSRLDAGRVRLDLCAFNVDDLVRDLRRLLRVRVERQHTELILERCGAFPDKIESDPVRIRQILLQLIGNALKFTPSGSVRVGFHLFETQTGGIVETVRRLRVDVCDTGVGIDPQRAARLFRPFSPGREGSDELTGLGLGLHVCQRLARMLGGEVTLIDSQVGKGSLFRLEVPVVVPAATQPAEGAKAADTNGHGGRSALGGWTSTIPTAPAAESRILLATDQDALWHGLQSALAACGVGITVKREHNQVVLAALAARDEGRPFDLVMIDSRLPDAGASAIPRELRRRGYGGRIVALSDHARFCSRECHLDAGCDLLADRSLEPAQLTQLVHRFSRGPTAPPRA